MKPCVLFSRLVRDTLHGIVRPFKFRAIIVHDDDTHEPCLAQVDATLCGKWSMGFGWVLKYGPITKRFKVGISRMLISRRKAWNLHILRFRFAVAWPNPAGQTRRDD
jgi:hypothetical protein